jgi:hypothetical protein
MRAITKETFVLEDGVCLAGRAQGAPVETAH